MRHSVEELRALTYRHRKRFLELFTRLGYGHLPSSFSWAEIATVLYYEILRLPDTELTQPADRMVLSKGHGSGMLFPIFEALGYYTREELEDALRVGGSTEKLRCLFLPGFDFYGGSLAIGLGMAAGLAKGDRLSGADWKTFCLVGDAECYEGAVWEAAHFAGHHGLDNLIVILDRNGLGCSDFTEHMLRLEPLADKWRSYGWEVSEIDGYDFEEIYRTLHRAAYEPDRNMPHCIIARTKKGQGLDYVIDKPLMHGYMPKGQEEIERAFRELRR